MTILLQIIFLAATGLHMFFLYSIINEIYNHYDGDIKDSEFVPILIQWGSFFTEAVSLCINLAAFYVLCTF